MEGMESTVAGCVAERAGFFCGDTGPFARPQCVGRGIQSETSGEARA